MAGKKKSLKRLRFPGQKTRHREFEDAIAQTTNDVVAHGQLPANIELEKRFPGINASPVARKEIYMRLVFQLKIRNYTAVQIANSLGMTHSNVALYLRYIRRQFEKEMTTFSVLGHVGRSLGVYKEMQAQAAKLVYDGKVKHTPKIMAINAVVNAEDRVNDLIKTLGVYKNIQFNPNLTNSIQQKDDTAHLRDFAMAILSGSDEVIDNLLEDENDEVVFDENDISLTS